MKRAAAILGLCLGVLIAADTIVTPVHAQSSGPEILVAQNNIVPLIIISPYNILPGNFLSRLFINTLELNVRMVFFFEHIKIQVALLNRAVQFDRNIYQSKPNGASP